MDSKSLKTIQRIINACVYGQLATIDCDGQKPRVRPVCAFLQDDFTILVPTHSATRKVAEIESNANVEICFVDDDHWQVRVAAHAELIDDPAAKRTLMETTLSPQLWKGFFPEGPSDSRFLLYRLHPKSFEWMKEWELRYRRVEWNASELKRDSSA